jgi:hypothetical protein
MNYTKPQVNTMGEATRVIASGQTQKPQTGPLEPHSMTLHVIPAYDLDE